MRPTLPVTNRTARAFTLIELVVILFVLVLITTAIMPRVVALGRSRRVKSLEARVARLPGEARNEAVRSRRPVRLRVDGDALVVERVPPSGAVEIVQRVGLGGIMQVEDARQDGRDADTGSWQWTVYPDGSADNGGLEFAEGSQERALQLSSDGSARWLPRGLPDAAPDRWPAGQLRQRS